MLNNISTLDELEKEAQQIDSFLNITCSEEMGEAAARGSELNIYMARSGKMLADAKYLQDEAVEINTILVHEQYKTMSTSIQKKLIESFCKRENRLVTWLDRINRTCVHQQQYMITLISKGKVEMQLSNNNFNQP
jgi:hypothetical protein